MTNSIYIYNRSKIIRPTPNVSLSKGRYLNDVRKFFGFLDPLPPLLLSHSRNLSALSSRFDQPPSLFLSAEYHP